MVVGGGGIFRDNIMKLTDFSGTVQVYNHSAVSCIHYPLLSVLPALRYRCVLLFFLFLQVFFFSKTAEHLLSTKMGCSTFGR